METITKILEQAPNYISATIGVLTALTAFFTLIKGDQPEKTFQKITDILKKISRK